jgi:hypothetical protein
MKFYVAARDRQFAQSCLPDMFPGKELHPIFVADLKEARDALTDNGPLPWLYFTIEIPAYEYLEALLGPPSTKSAFTEMLR